MFLTRRGARFTFQKRVPADLVPLFGPAPIRLLLPPCGAREARRSAALLGGVTEAEFRSARRRGMDDDQDPRDALIAELRKALAEEREAKKREAQMVDRLQETIDSLHREVTGLRAEFRNGSRREPDPEPMPLFSEEFPAFLARKRKDNPNSKYTRYTLPTAAKAWTEVVGDRPLLDYRPKDLQEFAWALARVPTNHSKLERFKRLSLRDAGDMNAGLKKPYPTLTSTTIRRQYASPIKSALGWICQQRLLRSPLAEATLDVPTDARPPTDRDPLSLSQIVRLLREAGKRARPDDKWLPLLGFATGCRLAELVYLQGQDIKWNQRARAWVLDLSDTIWVEGREIRRPLKTPGSSRVISLPRALVDIGFVDWARARPGFLFNELHRKVKNPPGAASKRQARLFEDVGIKKAYTEVFHSLRHSHKDWLRDLDVNDRTIDLQSGHALDTVAKRYGAKSLTDKEVHQLSKCEFPRAISQIASKQYATTRAKGGKKG